MVKVQIFAAILAFALLANSCAAIGLLKGLGLYGGSHLYGAGYGGLYGGYGGLGSASSYGLNRYAFNRCPSLLSCGLPTANIININKPSLIAKCLLFKKKLLEKKLGLLGCGYGPRFCY